MPFPLLPWGIAVGVVAVGGIGAYLAMRDAQRKTAGKRIVMIGPRASGKSTLHEFMTSPDEPILDGPYVPTQAPFHAPINYDRLGKAKWQAFRLDIEVADISGGKQNLADGLEACTDATAVCFLANVHRLSIDGEYFDRARLYAQQVGSWEIRAPILLVLSHLDLESDVDVDEVLDRPEVHEIRRALHILPTAVHAASLLDAQQVRRVADAVLEAIMKEGAS